MGLLSGPLGLLLGGVTGAAVGAIVDVAEDESDHALVDAFSRAVPGGTAAVVALVDEPTPTLLARVATAAGATVLRRSRQEVELRLAEAELDVRSAAPAGEDTQEPRRGRER